MDPYLRLTDSDPTPDPALDPANPSVTFKMVTNDYFFPLSFFAYYFLKIHFSKIKSHEEVTKR